MLDWAAHLEHFQSILFKYNLVGALTKPTMLRYFQKGPKPFILAKLKQQDLELESFNQMIKKAVDVKAKSTLWLCFNTKKMDQNYLWGNWPANSTIAKSQDSTIKNFQIEEPKVQDTESSLGPWRFESSKKVRKKKKKK